jgi:putative ABC transport system permease protein
MTSIDIPVTNLILGALLIIIPILILLEMKVKLIKTLLVSILRMIIQLAAIGLVLDYLFEWNNLIITTGWMFVMLVSATLITMERVKYPRAFILPLIFLPFLTATLIVLPYIIMIVVKPQTIYLSRYLVPLYGMLLGNSISSATLAIERLTSDLKNNWNSYYSKLAFGATSQEAAASFMQSALKASLLPRILNISAMGLVTLPGMMTGQILGGSSPTTAIKYQIIIMIAILAAVSLSVYIAMKLLVLRLFDHWGLPRHHLD